MNTEMPNFMLIVPELFVLTMACVVLVVDLFLSERTRVASYVLAQLTLVGAIMLTIALWAQESALTFSGTYIRDPMGDALKVAIYVMTFGVFLYSRQYLRERNIFKGEYYVLGLFGVLGMMIMVSAHNLLTVYLGLELLALSLYAMVAFNRDSRMASEAAMKYFVLGAMASGMLLYGMSILYGVTGSLDISEVNAGIAAWSGDGAVLVFATAFVVVGLAFKLGAVPFHMWMPDVYHGAPTSVTAYIGTAPKIAAFAMIMRLLGEALQGVHADWQNMLVLLALLSLGIGNIVAIAQTNIKRMLAYSTISHVGFLLLGIMAGSADGYSASMFYAIVYALMAMGAFGMIILLSREGFEADNLDDFKGVARRSPWYAFVMLLLMLSMAGVPPTVGFYAKLVVLKAAIEAGMVWLAAVAVTFAVIGAFYYLRVIKLMYFDEPEDSSPVEAGTDMRILLSANGLAVLVLGLFPGALLGLCVAVI